MGDLIKIDQRSQKQIIKRVKKILKTNVLDILKYLHALSDFDSVVAPKASDLRFNQRILDYSSRNIMLQGILMGIGLPFLHKI